MNVAEHAIAIGRTLLRVEIRNVFGTAGLFKGRACGTAWLAARILPTGCRADTVKDFGSGPEAEAECRAYVELWNGPLS